MNQFVHETRYPFTADQLFAFHERPDALNLLLPPWQRVRVISRTGGLAKGARVEFRIYIGPIPITWIAVHTEYKRNEIFVDEQQKGPFAYWRHAHIFIPNGAGCVLRDEIAYSLPLGLTPILGWILNRPLRRMFDYRHAVTAREVAAP
ncbi:MAG: SRPBCC family protein [Acidobacteria bacterium]|nr:SRPBCC family protein [Acidobacteriota bacterium]